LNLHLPYIQVPLNMAYPQASLWAVGIILPTLSFILVAVRFWMRLSFQKTYLGADDWLILVATIFITGVAFDVIYASYVGLMGMDGLPINPLHEVPQKKIDYATIVIEKFAYGAVKLSLLFFYRRIFTLQRFRRINNVIIALIVAWTLAYFFASVFSCGAYPQANWDPEAKTKTTCINLFTMLLSFAITDVLTDAAIMWMPYPEIKRLQLSSRDKWGLSGIFLLGTLDLLIGVVRLGFIVATQTIPAVNTNFNPPENTAPTFWTLTELGVGVIAAHLPALAPLYRKRREVVSSIMKKLSRSQGQQPDSNTAAVLEKGGSPVFDPDDQTLNGSKTVLQNQDKHKSEHIGMWDQFERMEDSMDADEQDRDVLGVENRV